MARLGGSMQKNNGFTLIELIVTIAVMAIIAMMAAPSFGDLIEKRKLDAETRELSFVLSEARAQATTLRSNVTLKFQHGQNTSILKYWAPKSENIILDNTANDVDFSDVVFTPIGQPLQRTKTIIDPADSSTKVVRIPLKFSLCNPEIKQSRTISVSMNGTVTSIESGQC